MTTFEQAWRDAYGTPEAWQAERERRLRLLAATGTARADHGSTRSRHVDMVGRMVLHPERPVLAFPRGRRAVTIQRGAHLRHGDCRESAEVERLRQERRQP